MQIAPLEAADQLWVLQLAHEAQVYCPDSGNEDLALSAKCAGEPLAYIAWQMVLDEATLLGIAVALGARRQKVASTLYRHSEQILHAQGVRTLFLELRQSNNSAYQFYRKHGFEQIGVRQGYYQALVSSTHRLDAREDAIVMRKILPRVTLKC